MQPTSASHPLGQEAPATHAKNPSHFTSHSHELLQSTVLRHVLVPSHSISHAPGPQAMSPVQELLPSHARPQEPEAPQSMSPVQAPLAQVMSQEKAEPQSMPREHAPKPQVMTQGTFAGQRTTSKQETLEHVITQLPSTQVPPRHSDSTQLAGWSFSLGAPSTTMEISASSESPRESKPRRPQAAARTRPKDQTNLPATTLFPPTGIP